MKFLHLSLLVGISLLTHFLHAQQAAFTLSENSGCSPLVVSFDASASTGVAPLTYVWDFGNGNTSTGPDQQSPGAIYTSPGTFSVRLTVVDANNVSSAEVVQQVRVFANPVASFTVNDSVGCPPLEVSFTNGSTAADAPITDWVWDFGDGKSSIDPNTTHTYTPGTYTVSLIIRDQNGCQDDVVKPNFITSHPDLTPVIQTTSKRFSCTSPYQVALTAQLPAGSPAGLQFLWNFGDGNTSTERNPQHIYQQNGTFSVSLSVTDPATNCTFSSEVVDMFQVQDPTPTFAVSQTTGCAPTTIQYSSQGFEGATEIFWDFGDGTQLAGAANDALLFSPSHTYQVEGEFTPSVRVIYGENSCEKEFSLPTPISIRDVGTIDILPTETSACQLPFTTQFQTTIMDAASWSWNFGDGTTSTEATPTHTYTTAGNYTVCLSLETADGCKLTASEPNLIRVGTLVPRFSHNLRDFVFYPPMWDGRDDTPIQGGCLPLEITFQDQSISPTPIVSRDWTFGDGNELLQSGDPQAIHTYLTEGKFSVSLTVTTEDGCTATTSCDTCIIAGERPEALLDTTGYPLLQCCSANTLFQNTTAPGTHDYVWYEVTTGDWDGFEVNDTSNGNWDFGSTVPVFRDSGQYVSTDFYAYNNGCVDKFELIDWTMLRPPYGSAGIDTFQCKSNFVPGEPICFDTSMVLFLLDTAYIDSVVWEFGDPAGTTSNEFYPCITYPDTGAYWLTVTTWNFDNGCSCRVSGEQFLQIKVQADTTFVFDPEEGCSPLLVTFDGPEDNVSEIEWALSGGFQSTDNNPVFLLEELGSYDISLIVEGAPGCRDTITREDAITVTGTQAILELDKETGCLPVSLTLTDRSVSTGNILAKRWILPDGTVFEENGLQLTHTIEALSELDSATRARVPVILELVDDVGCTDRDTVWLLASSPDPAFQLAKVSLCEGDSIFLEALSGDSIGISPLAYEWNIPAVLPGPSKPFRQTLFFPEGQDYEISLTVRDSIGCSTTITEPLSVEIRRPLAAFQASPTEAICPPLLVNFEDTSVVGKSSIVKWDWTFSDGVSSTLQNPARIFTQPDNYDVSLTVTDSLGCQDSLFIPNLIQLTGVEGGFEISGDQICVGESVSFTASSPNAGSYTWDFGDGEIGVGETVSHKYSEANVNFPSLILKDSSGVCSVTITDTLEVFPIPELDLPEDSSFCFGEEMLIDAETEGAVYQWSTGDTSSSITVAASGTYSVEVTYPLTGCSSSDRTAVLVFPLPEIFLAGPNQACEGDSVLISASSNHSIQQIAWTPDFSRDSLGTQWVYLATEDISYSVEVIDEEGCENSLESMLTVIPEPQVDLTHEPVCDGDVLELDASAPNIDNELLTVSWRDSLGTQVGNGLIIGIRKAGTYSLEYVYEGCTYWDSTEVSFHPLPESNIYDEIINCVYREEGVQLDAGEHTDYFWEYNGSTDRTIRANDSAIYYVEVFNEFSCSVVDSIAIVDNCPPLFYIPNVFTPNGDGENDTFNYDGDYYQDFSIQIFNRWGRVIYESDDPEVYWDGTFKEEDVPEGVYVYLIRFRGTHPSYDKLFSRSGSITVVR